MLVLWRNIAPTSVARKSLMAKTWYPTNFSGFYVNGKSYYKLTLQSCVIVIVNIKILS